jgi:hypothetical protein
MRHNDDGGNFEKVFFGKHQRQAQNNSAKKYG